MASTHWSNRSNDGQYRCMLADYSSTCCWSHLNNKFLPLASIFHVISMYSSWWCWHFALCNYWRYYLFLSTVVVNFRFLCSCLRSPHSILLSMLIGLRYSPLFLLFLSRDLWPLPSVGQLRILSSRSYASPQSTPFPVLHWALFPLSSSISINHYRWTIHCHYAGSSYSGRQSCLRNYWWGWPTSRLSLSQSIPIPHWGRLHCFLVHSCCLIACYWSRWANIAGITRWSWDDS